jgi:acyl-CoA synthetase (AMP-forming)/AMP-acid ligase II
MRILVDHGDSGSRDLDQAWADAATFAYLPKRNGAQEAWAAAALDGIPEPLRTGHFALLSSGSTGEAKLVVGSRARAERLCRVLHDAQASEPVRRTVALLPLTYSYAFVNQWLWARTLARDFEPTSGFSRPAELAAALARPGSAMVCLVAAHVSLLEQHFADRVFPEVIRIHFAGSRFPQERLASVRRAFPNADIFNNFGCVEAMPRLALRRAEDGDSASDIGHPLPGVELGSSDEGRLLFRSPYAAVGYCDAGGFHAIEADAWICTGDLGHRAANGRWILDGRAGEVFKRYGEKISLSLLLESLRPEWAGDAAFYRETDPLGEPGHVLVLAPSPTGAERRTILAALRQRHARAHWPLRIESAATLPLLPNGKVDAAALGALPDRRVEWSQRLG